MSGGPSGAVKPPLAFPTVNVLSMVFLCVRTARLMALFGNFRPGQVHRVRRSRQEGADGVERAHHGRHGDDGRVHDAGERLDALAVHADFLHQFAVLVVGTIGFSLFVSTLFFMPVLATIGPEGTQGDIVALYRQCHSNKQATRNGAQEARA